MNRDLIRIKHMIDASEEILFFINGRNRLDLDKNRMLSLSVVHLLELMGEAASKLSPEFREKYYQIPWKSVIQMRNRLIHGYFDIDLDIVWTTIKDDVPFLLKKLREIESIENS